MMHITEVMYLFLRVLDALQYLNCWGVSQLYDNFPSNTQNYSSRRVRAQTEGGMCKYRQSTEVITKYVQVYLTNVYSMHVLCESVDCECSHFQMCSLQIWFPVCRPSVTSSGYRLVLYTAHTNISKTGWFLDNVGSWSALY